MSKVCMRGLFWGKAVVGWMVPAAQVVATVITTMGGIRIRVGIAGEVTVHHGTC